MPRPPRLPDRPLAEIEPPETALEVIRQREALEELVKTDGWRVFLAYVAQEWEGRGYRARMKSALNNTNDPIGPRVVDRAADEISRLMKWPNNQIAELKGVADE